MRNGGWAGERGKGESAGSHLSWPFPECLSEHMTRWTFVKRCPQKGVKRKAHAKECREKGRRPKKTK